MANSQYTITEIRVKFLEDLTIVSFCHQSDDPLGQGWRSKRFPATMSLVEILSIEGSQSLLWNNGIDEIFIN